MEETLTVPVMSAAGWSAAEFDDIVREHQARIYRVLWCELRDDEAAATLTQDCFLKAYRGRAEFRGEASVSTWLVRIAVNLARDYQRNRRQGFWRRLLGSNAAGGRAGHRDGRGQYSPRRPGAAGPRAAAAGPWKRSRRFLRSSRPPSICAFLEEMSHGGNRCGHGRRGRNREVAPVARG